MASINDLFSSYTTPQLGITTDGSSITGVTNNLGTAANAATSTDFMSSLSDALSGAFGGTSKTGAQTSGWGTNLLGALTGIGNSYLGLQQYNLAKETLEENKKEYAQNYAAQKTTTNAELEDRQRARVASNPTAYQSVSDYMSQNGIK